MDYGKDIEWVHATLHRTKNHAKEMYTHVTYPLLKKIAHNLFDMFKDDALLG